MNATAPDSDPLIPSVHNDTMSLLVELGFRPCRIMGETGLEFQMGPVTLQALRCIGPRFREVVLLSGQYSTPRTMGLIEQALPVTYARRDDVFALLADACCDSASPPAQWEPVWLLMGRQYRHRLAGGPPVAYVDRLRCVVSREWLRVALRTLSLQAASAPAGANVTFAFDGEVLTVRLGPAVIPVPAQGDQWPLSYALPATMFSRPPGRLLGERVEVSVYDGSLYIGRNRYPGAEEQPGSNSALG